MPQVINSKFLALSNFDNEDQYSLDGKKLKGNHIYFDNLYGAYSYRYKEKQFLQKSEISDIARTFKETLLVTLFGGNVPIAKVIENSSIETIFSKEIVEKNLDYQKPNDFSKTVFLAIYTRVKPLNMGKENFINAMISVMKPCII